MMTSTKALVYRVSQFDYSVNGKWDPTCDQVKFGPPQHREVAECPAAAEIDESPAQCEQYLDTRILRGRRILPRLTFSRGDDPPETDSSLSYQPSPHPSQPLPQIATPTDHILSILSEYHRLQKARDFSPRPTKFVRNVLWDAIAHPGRPYPESSRRPTPTPRARRYPIYLPMREPDWGP